MNFTFVETVHFTRHVRVLLDDESYRCLQNELRDNPLKGEVIPGCGGLRKARVEHLERGKGKRGGCRVIYLHVAEAQRIYFVAIYSKDEQDDLTREQKRVLKTIAEQTKESLRLLPRPKGKD